MDTGIAIERTNGSRCGRRHHHNAMVPMPKTLLGAVYGVGGSSFTHTGPAGGRP